MAETEMPDTARSVPQTSRTKIADPVAAALAAKDTGKSVPAKVRDKAMLPGALSIREVPITRATQDTDENGQSVESKAFFETGETREAIVQEEYGEWPWCQLCKPERQIEPSNFSRHQNLHTVAQVDDD